MACPVEPGFITVAGTMGQPPWATIALIALDRGLGRGDVGAGERRRAERRIGDPGLRRGVAFLGRKLIAMEGARSGLLRLPLAAAEQAAALPPKNGRRRLNCRCSRRNYRRSYCPGRPSSKRRGRRWRARCCRREAPRPNPRRRGCPRLSVDSANSALAAPRPLRLLSLLNYRRFALITLVPMIPELCLVIRHEPCRVPGMKSSS